MTTDTLQPKKATDWFLALVDRPEDDILQARFAAWLAADADHAREWAEVSRTYEVLGMTVPAAYESWARNPSEAPKPRPMPNVDRRVVAAGARSDAAGFLSARRAAVGLVAAALVACFAFFLLPAVIGTGGADYVTDTAETRHVALPDGSLVHLGPESAIATVYREDLRGVRLLHGVAFFEVVPDPARPFRVEAAHIDATAIGTTFEVRLDDAGAGVAVREGAVRVEDRHLGHRFSEELHVGEWVRVARDGVRQRGTRPGDHIASWKDGRLVVTDHSVGEVVDDLRRYYAGVVVLRGDGLARQPVTGVYGLADPASALRAIAKAHNASIVQLSPWVVVISGD